MTEQQIRDGYERLDSAVRAPQDAFERVEKRMRVRRRRRRVGAAAGAAGVVAAVAGYAAISMGGSDDGRESVVAVDPPPSRLVMTRPDGSTFEFSDLEVTCDPAGASAGGTASDERSRIYLSSPIDLDGERLTRPFVHIEGDVETLGQPRTYSLPLEGADGSSQSAPLIVFMADPEGAPGGNEVVSSAPSTGTVRVVRASCDPTPVLELEIDATLASEEQTGDGQSKDSLRLEGAVR